MGIEQEEALTMARKIALYNSEAIHFVKNSLMKITPAIQKKLDETREKFFIILKTNYVNVEPLLILANSSNNNNHDLTKLDIELIAEMMLEEPSDELSN